MWRSGFQKTIPARRLVACPWVGIRHSRDWGLERGWCGNSRDFPSGAVLSQKQQHPRLCRCAGGGHRRNAARRPTSGGRLGQRWTRYARCFPGNGAERPVLFEQCQCFGNASGPLPVPINYGLVSDRPVVGKWR